jgi:AcrR family transcriptional regulator
MAVGNRRTQIMRAVETLFTSRQVHEITLDDVVREAGVGKGTLYRYFKNKDDLFFQTATSGFEELHELLTRRVHEEAPFARQLLAACRGVTSFHQRRRQLLRMVESEQSRMFWCRGEVRAQWTELRRKILSAMAACERMRRISVSLSSESSVSRSIHSLNQLAIPLSNFLSYANSCPIPTPPGMRT